MKISQGSLHGRGRLSIIGSLLAVCLFGTQVWATTVIAVSADDLVTRSGAIVHASCDSATSFKDERGHIMTRYVFRVHETFKGDDARSIEFVQPGGEVDGKRLVIPGLSGYQRDAEVFLFLTDEYRGDRRMPIGLDQGVYNVITREGDGQQTVRRNISALKVVDEEDKTVAAFPENVSVDTFKAALDAKIEEIGK